MNLLPILKDQREAGACDWAVEGKGGAGSSREERKGRWKMEEEGEKDGAEVHGLEKSQVAKNLIAGEESSVVVDLPHLAVFTAYKYSNWVVGFLHGLIGVGDLLQQLTVSEVQYIIIMEESMAACR